MGVDLNKVVDRQKELEQQQANRQGGGMRFWAPKPGSNKIRLMPPWTSEGTNANQFDREIWVHWSVGPDESMFVCPRKTPKLDNPGPCPVCDHCDELRKSPNLPDIEAAQALGAKPRHYSNIIDIEDPVYTDEDDAEWRAKSKDPSREPPFTVGDTKIQIFNYGPQIYKGFIDLFAELKMDLTDLDKGYDIIVKKEGKERNTRYSTVLHPVVRPVEIIKDGSIVDRSDALPLTNLDTAQLLQPKPYDEMAKALSGVPNGPPGLPPAQSSPPPAALPPARVATPPKPVPPKAAAPAPAAKPAPAPAKPPTATAAKPAPAKAVAAAAPPPSAVREVAAEEEDPPECYQNAGVWSDKDPECVGGTVGSEEYDPCPFWQRCGEAVGKLVPAPKKPRRTPAKAVAAPPPPPEPEPVMDESEADALERQMTEALE